jgi:hypothetical protein
MEAITPQLQSIIDYLQKQYEPTNNYTDAAIRMSTGELHEKLNLFFPVDGFTPAVLFTWLNDLGYTYQESGLIKPEWLLKKRM